MEILKDFAAKPASAEELLTAAELHEPSTWQPHPFGGFLDQHCGGYPQAVNAEILSLNPFIVYTNLDHGRALGLADVWLEQGYEKLVPLPKRKFFLISLWWSIDDPSSLFWVRACAIRHRMRFKSHVLVFLCNTEREANGLQELGEIAVLSNHNLNLLESDFFPIAGQEKIYDAVYNARLTPWKRHYLAAGVETCAYIYYRFAGSSAIENLVMSYQLERAPRHTFVNRVANDKPISLTRAEVNVVLNASRVGLCLSAEEGAMYSSLEYMFSGIPVVSTRAKGGRDRYLSPESSIICGDSVNEVAEAVRALTARAIPAHRIRESALAMVARDRRDFRRLLNDIRAIEGYPPEDEGAWPYRSKISTPRGWEEYRTLLLRPQTLE